MGRLSGGQDNMGTFIGRRFEELWWLGEYILIYAIRLHVILYRGHKPVVQRRVRVLCQGLRLGLRSEHGGLD